MMAEMSCDDDPNPEPSTETSPKLDGLRRSRRNSELYAEVLDLRTTGMSPRQIAPRTGMSVRTVERWLAAGGEPSTGGRPRARFSWVLSRSISKDAGRKANAGVAPVERNQAPRLCRQQSDRLQVDRRPPAVLIDRSANARWGPPSRRNCAWLLSEDPTLLDQQTGQFLGHLYGCAPELLKAGDLARRFAALIRGDDDAGLEQWIEDATDSELASLAVGIGRDIAAVRAAITQPWITSPVEGQINRLKTIKRQMYGRVFASEKQAAGSRLTTVEQTGEPRERRTCTKYAEELLIVALYGGSRTTPLRLAHPLMLERQRS
ncbi:hypothetical protein NKH87_33855 [Mesorhizobium australicum]